MRITATSLVLLGLSTQVIGQITITANDTTTFGDAIALYQIDSMAPAYDANTGSGAAWDYSGYAAANNCFMGVDTVVDAQTTSAASEFPASTHADIIQGNLTYYFTQDGSGRESQGYSFFEPTIQDVIFKLDVDPVQNITFPFSLGSSYTDLFSGSVVSQNILVNGALISGAVTVTADGEGTLTFPTGVSTNALRIKYDEHDTITAMAQEYIHRVTYYYYNLDSSNLPIFIHSSYEASGAFPTPMESTVYSMLPACGVSVAENSLDEMSVYPNPVEDVLYVDLGEARNVKVHMYDVLGAEVMGISNASGTVTLDTEPLTKGLYLVRVESGSETRTERVFVR